MASVWTRLGFGGSRRAARARRAVLRRAAIGSAALGTLAGGTAAGVWYRLFRRPLPKTRGRLRALGLSAAVEIRRDRWGVPHIRARTRRDLWLAQGLCHGQDRLWQLDLYRRMASGRLSEIGGRETLPADRLMRTLGLRRVAEREVAELDPAMLGELDAYCAGVNTAVEAAAALPAEFQILRLDFEPWRPVDMLGASLPGVPGVSMGQTNDVAFAFTNAMADVMDLFVERIDGDSYEFEGEKRPLETVVEEIRIRGRLEPERLEVRSTHHGPIVNAALGADEAEPLALRWSVVDAPAISEANLRVLEPTTGPELVDLLAAHTAPVSSMLWADRHGSIGYKAVGRIPVRRGDCPDLPRPGWDGEFEWDGYVPYAEMPEARDPECGYLITANNRIVPDEYPHHITSDYLDGYRARRIEQLILARPDHDHDSFEAMQFDDYSIPGVETVHRLARLRPRDQREVAAIERLKSWDGRLTPDSVAGSIYQAFTMRLAREVARAALRDRDLAERWLDRSDSGFTTHVTSPWRWHSHLLALWEEADEELVGRPWEGLVLDALRGALDDLEDRFRPDQE